MPTHNIGMVVAKLVLYAYTCICKLSIFTFRYETVIQFVKFNYRNKLTKLDN